MNVFWLDASALTKRYVAELGTPLINQILSPVSHSQLLASADARLVTAAQLEGLITFNPEIGSQAALDALLVPARTSP